jgi:hypothetical protein
LQRSKSGQLLPEPSRKITLRKVSHEPAASQRQRFDKGLPVVIRADENGIFAKVHSRTLNARPVLA